MVPMVHSFVTDLKLDRKFQIMKLTVATSTIFLK